MKTHFKPHRLFTKFKGLFLCYCAGGLLLFLASCQKYLDAKPDKSLQVPSTAADFQALLDNPNFIVDYPYASDIGSDDYFVLYSDWSTFSQQGRNDYVWDAGSTNDQDWNFGYRNILYCNVVLNGIDGASGSTDSKDNAKGSAYFFRGYLFDQMANEFTLPYNKATSSTDLGLPLRLEADLSEKIERATLEQTFQQSLSDLKKAIALLPVTPTVKTRPSKPAAYGALARTYLAMSDYANAYLYADSCLALYSTLLDYNTLDTASYNPFELFNNEVIYHATSSGLYDVVDPYYDKVDTNLYAQYAPNDLRKKLFYYYNGGGYYTWKGDYYGASYGPLFGGIATDEQLLIRAESSVRLGKVADGINDLNTLLATRYVKGTYTPYSASLNTDDALRLVLSERRKELAFRSGLRWSDLKRLNQDPRFAKTLVRNLDGKQYTLPPNDNRYAFLIPASVVQLSGSAQNPR